MNSAVAERPSPLVVLELLKPITWFPPMWAFGCGVVVVGRVAGTALAADRRRRAAGRADGLRHQPGRERLVRPPCRCHQRAQPADSLGTHCRAAGAFTSRWPGRCCRCCWRPRSGTWGFVAAVVGLVLAWAYSAPPMRLKRTAGGATRPAGCATKACPGSPAPP